MNGYWGGRRDARRRDLGFDISMARYLRLGDGSSSCDVVAVLPNAPFHSCHTVRSRQQRKQNLAPEKEDRTHQKEKQRVREYFSSQYASNYLLGRLNMT